MHSHPNPNPEIKRSHPQTKKPNPFKVLYKMSKERKSKALNQDDRQSQASRNDHRRDTQPVAQNEETQDLDDSLENIQSRGEGLRTGVRKQVPPLKGDDSGQQKGSKKRTHSRSHSCPFIAPMQSGIWLPNKADKVKSPPRKVVEGESRRTLKKKSAHFYLKHQKQPENLHRYNGEHSHRAQHKNTSSHFSQESNTIIVHALPIEQLSSMLYSSNSLNKNSLAGSCSQTNLAKQIFSIHNDLYFQTRLHQQIKMYDLNEEMQALQRETNSVRIKQGVLEKLANQFEMHRLEEEGQDDEDCDDSLLIHG